MRCTIDDDGIVKNQISTTAQTNEKLTFVCSNLGFYKIGLIVNDGIVNSTELVICIKVIPKPHIKADRNDYWLKSQADIINYKNFWVLVNPIKYKFLTSRDSFFTINEDTLYRNEGLIIQDNKIETTFFLGKSNGKVRFKMNANPGKYDFHIQTVNQNNPLLKSNVETVTVHNQAHFPLWFSLHTEDLSFNTVENNLTEYFNIYGVSLEIRAFLYRYFMLETGAIAYFNTTINGQKYAPISPNIFSHYALGYKIPITGIFKNKVKLDPTITLFYRNLPNDFDTVSESFLFDWNLGWEAELSLLLFYNRSFSLDLSAIQLFGSQRVIIGTGISFTFDVYDMF